MGGSKLTSGHFVAGQQPAQGAASRDRPRPHRQAGFIGVRLELRHQHRGRGRQIVRVNDLEERLGEARELGVQLELYTGGQERDALDQPLDVRIRNLEAAHAQPGGDLGKLLRELGAHFPQML